MSRRPLAWIFCRSIGILLLSGLAGATLVRLAPGFGIEEQMLDTRLTEDSRRALSERHAGERDPVSFYIRFMAGILHGDAGTSTVYGRPVGSLIRERAARTIVDVGEGLAAGWCTAMLIALAVVFSRRTAAALPAFALSASLLSLPSAVVAMICLLTGLTPAFATAAVVFPRIFPHAYEQLKAGLAAPHVLTGRACGISEMRLLWFYVGPSVAMPLLALAGVSVTLAFGASIPIEALSDSPGMGQLAWRAALGRDMPVLVAITLLLTTVTVAANMIVDIVEARAGDQSE